MATTPLQPTREREPPPTPPNPHAKREGALIVLCIGALIWFIVKYCMGGAYSGL